MPCRGQEIYQPNDDLFILPQSRLPRYSDDDVDDSFVDDSVLRESPAPRLNQFVVSPASTGQVLSSRSPIATVTPRQSNIIATCMLHCTRAAKSTSTAFD